MSWLDDVINRVQAKVTGDVGYLTPQQRIAMSIDKTGGVASGDWGSAVNQTGNAGIPIRADGGIYNQPVRANPQTVRTWQNLPDNSNVLSATDQDSGGGWTGSGDRPVGWNGESGNATSSAEDRALQAWNEAKRFAGEERNRVQGIFDDILKAVGAFRGRTEEQYTNADQEITNTASERLGGNVRTGQELFGQTNRQGRALGLGDSSRFIRQNSLAGRLAADQGSTLATKGENQRSNQLIKDQNLDKADAQEREAERYRQGALNNVAAIEAGGLNDYQSRLDAITDYANQLARVSPLQASGLTQMAPNFSGVANNLNSSAGGGAPVQGGSENINANPVSNPTLLANIYDPRRQLYRG